MMKSKFLILAGAASVAIAYTSCVKDPVLTAGDQGNPQLPATAFDYLHINTPDGIQELTKLSRFSNSFSGFNDPALESISNESVTLGRVLFYDRKLSINGTVACASCHNQSKGFADGRAGSGGFADKITPRNSMAIINPIMQNNLFWDSRASSAFDLSLRPVFNHVEMGMETDDMLVSKLQKTEYYPSLFQQAFGSTVVSKDRIATAISHFLNSMITVNSKFDYGKKNDFADFTALELMGKDLFFSSRLNCTACHAGTNFSAGEIPGSGYSSPTVKGTANIGLDMSYKDNGLGDGKFRIPGLRNIALTAPYMHDGRFATLADVIEHYNSGIKAHPFLDDNLKVNGEPKRMNLSSIEKEALIAFLNTLTDVSYTKDTKYSNPFKN